MSTNVTREAPTPPVGMRDAEQAPSVMAQDDPVVARLIGMFAAALVIFGGAALMMQRMGNRPGVGQGWATFFLAVGVVCLLFHAVYDTDIQFRRLYMGFGYVAIAVGVLLCSIDQFGTGFLLLALAVGFLLAFLRNETDEKFREVCQVILGVVGILGALIGLVGGNLYPEFVWPRSQPVTNPLLGEHLNWPYGLFLSLLGVLYLAACIGTRGISNDSAFRLGRIMGWLGAAVFLFALVRSIFPATFSRSSNPEFFVPSGAILMSLGLLYVMTSLALTSDHPYVVLTRRELDAFFYSPIAYLVLFGFIVLHWFTYFLVIKQLSQGPTPEPIVRDFAFQITSIFFIVFAVPALTMRLLSEEQRTGTLEVLLTSPVDETVVVLSKFTAAFLLYLLMWLPFVLFMVALRVGGGHEFDYRPLMSFGVAVVVTGAGFISMGLFCSSLSKNQIISAVLAFTGMLLLTLVYILKQVLTDRSEMAAKPDMINAILEHTSYIDLWFSAIKGQLVFRTLLFPLSMAIFFLFLTIKVLEARKWK